MPSPPSPSPPLPRAGIRTSTRDRSHARSFIHASSPEKHARTKQRREISAYSSMFTTMPQRSRSSSSSSSSTKADSENNKNKTRAGKDRRAWRRGEGGQAEFSKFARNVTFWPYFEEARERARAIWPRWIRESTKLSESGRRGKKGPKRKVRERERARWKEEARCGEGRRRKEGPLSVYVGVRVTCDSYMCRIRTRVITERSKIGVARAYKQPPPLS